MRQDRLPEAHPAASPADGEQVVKPRGASFFAGLMRLMYETLETVLPALLIVLVVNVFLAQATRVEGQSMEPNLQDNQRLIIEKVSYHLHSPQRGDIIVLQLPSHNSDPLIKRVIGLPGETVEITNGQVLINGQVLNEPYLNQYTYQGMAPRAVPANEVFVLGDNRGSSNDSRAFGFVPFSDIIGRAWFRYWPPLEIGPLR
ncbi:MAG TPA: signal peptidase I [Anaerolineae bacterium]|nr:signal peptidase I [Anaerolineae bacterium]HOQ97483.1 signal peptidase I [Anaerolineae bacterium]HPL29788.1 signal peptidase I [Anaerolineae bacterium]